MKCYGRYERAGDFLQKTVPIGYEDFKRINGGAGRRSCGKSICREFPRV